MVNILQVPDVVKKHELQTADIYDWKVKLSSKITPIFQADFFQSWFQHQKLNRKYREIPAPVLCAPDKDGFSFFWVQFQFIH